jgi:hypothetical protein
MPSWSAILACGLNPFGFKFGSACPISLVGKDSKFGISSLFFYRGFSIADSCRMKEKKNVRELLPFWARELLAMNDGAEKNHTVREPSAKEDS